MLKIINYRKVEYHELIAALKKSFDDSGKSPNDLLKNLGLSTRQSFRNLFNTREQLVKDNVITKAAKELELPCLIVSQAGAKLFFLHKDEL